MLAMLDGVLLPPDGKGFRRFAMHCYTEEEPDTDLAGGVRDHNHAEDIVNALTAREGSGDGSFIAKGRAPKGAQALWNIWMRVSSTRRGVSKYQLDYHKFPGCPVAASEEMMEIFALLRRHIKRAQRDLRERVAAADAAAADEKKKKEKETWKEGGV